MLLYILPVAVITALVITYSSAWKGITPICDRYVLNVYLYLITLLLLLNWFIMIIIKNGYVKKIKPDIGMIIIFSILYIGTFFGAIFIPKEWVFVKHLLALLYISLSSLVLAIIYEFYGIKSVVEAFIIVTVMFVILTIFAWKFQEYLTDKISWTFLILFILIIIVELIMDMYYPSSVLTKIVILVVVGLLCYLILIKTKKMIENSKTCVLPDYIKESLGFLIDIENIFIRILELKR